MRRFCQHNFVEAIIDASHPYAIEVSAQAIAVASKLNIPYLRYERENYQVSILYRANLIQSNYLALMLCCQETI